jgi:hypothetical protein
MSTEVKSSQWGGILLIVLSGVLALVALTSQSISSQKSIKSFMEMSFGSSKENKPLNSLRKDSDSDFVISSSAFTDGGYLPDAYTCLADDGGVSPPLEWSGAPDGTVQYVLFMNSHCNAYRYRYEVSSSIILIS